MYAGLGTGRRTLCADGRTPVLAATSERNATVIDQLEARIAGGTMLHTRSRARQVYRRAAVST